MSCRLILITCLTTARELTGHIEAYAAGVALRMRRDLASAGEALRHRTSSSHNAASRAAAITVAMRDGDLFATAARGAVSGGSFPAMLPLAMPCKATWLTHRRARSLPDAISSCSLLCIEHAAGLFALRSAP